VGLRDARIRDLMEIVAERDAAISGLARRAEDAVRRAEDAEAALADLAAQIKAVEASSSWRLTAPLRRLRRSGKDS
jgi:hypothetical protein